MSAIIWLHLLNPCSTTYWIGLLNQRQSLPSSWLPTLWISQNGL